VQSSERFEDFVSSISIVRDNSEQFGMRPVSAVTAKIASLIFVSNCWSGIFGSYYFAIASRSPRKANTDPANRFSAEAIPASRP
jgi:hypothetical protein